MLSESALESWAQIEHNTPDEVRYPPRIPTVVLQACVWDMVRSKNNKEYASYDAPRARTHSSR